MSESETTGDQLLEQLVAKSSSIWITHCPDEDWPRFGMISVRAVFLEDKTNRSRHASATSISEAMERILGVELKFLCKMCGEHKARRMFTFDRDRPKSRHPYCLECNAKRSARYRKRKAEQEDALMAKLGLQIKRLKKNLI